MEVAAGDEMNEIMPYYNKLYESELIKFDPMTDTDTTTEHHGTNSGNGVRRNLYSETPQGALQNLENETYLTNASKDISEGTGRMIIQQLLRERQAGQVMQICCRNTERPFEHRLANHKRFECVIYRALVRRLYVQ